MRRSAAPSQLYAKRPRFNAPIPRPTSTTPAPATHEGAAFDGYGERSKKDVLNLITKVTDTISNYDNDTLECSDGIGTGSEQSVQSFQPNPRLVIATSGPGADRKSASGKRFIAPTVKKAAGVDIHAESCSTEPENNVSSSSEDIPNSMLPGHKTPTTNQLTASLPIGADVGTQKSKMARPSIGAFRRPSKFCPPAGSIRTPLTPKTIQHQQENGDEPKSFYYNTVWCKLSKKKHKKWEGDAILRAKGRSVTLMDTEGKEIGRGSGYKVAELASLAEGHTLVVGGKEIEVMSVLKEEDYTSGKCFQTAVMVTNKSPLPLAKPKVTAKAFVKPQLSEVPQMKITPVVVQPKFDPQAPDALVMSRPDQTHQWEHNRQRLPVVDVVVDPHLAYHLRPHQRAGVCFLYQCAMGMKDFIGQGAILADEMGLGKTLQCISLIWTLYKQGPYGGRPVVRRVLIITPGSLVKNWMREFKKWLGSERLKVFAVGTDNKVADFVRCTVYPVMIISYEMFMRNADTVKAVNFDLVVCDEGHRLKNSNIKTTTLMMGLETRRRIVLTGTPVQNDLKELFSIVDFCNPGILGTSSAFQHVYTTPILASRQPSATQAEEALGETRAQELNRVTAMFILRRTQEINNKYLPPKVEIVLFCQPSALQLQLYRKLLSSRAVRCCLSSPPGGDMAQHLTCIAAMKKLCNCPSLLHSNAEQSARRHTNTPDSATEEPDLYSGLLPVYPVGYDACQLALEHCGKLRVMEQLLYAAHVAKPRQRVVLVSNYTQTLDVLVRVLQAADYSFLRLDGKTPTGKRQQLVESFNNVHSDVFVFLLSSKAGGVGLNLIGASRLILYDIDWNPANDLQAMARIWRDGQRHRVYIYRLLTTGSLEEKMYQRQVSKQSLSGVVVDSKANSKLNFSPEELKDLFRLHEDSLCCTHELLGCECGDPGHAQTPVIQDTVAVSRPCQLQTGSPSATQKNLCMDELMAWRHEKGPGPDLNHVDPIVGDARLDDVTYAFWNVSGQQLAT